MSNRSETFPSSFELWEFVTAFEEGALPTTACTEASMAAIAVWYLSMLTPREAMTRLEAGLRRNHLRFAARLVALGNGASAFAEAWASALSQILGVVGADDPVAIANRLMPMPEVEERKAA